MSSMGPDQLGKPQTRQKMWYYIRHTSPGRIRQTSTRVPARLTSTLKQEVQAMLERGTMELSRSEWYSPVVLVEKKGRRTPLMCGLFTASQPAMLLRTFFRVSTQTLTLKWGVCDGTHDVRMATVTAVLHCLHEQTWTVCVLCLLSVSLCSFYMFVNHIIHLPTSVNNTIHNGECCVHFPQPLHLYSLNTFIPIAFSVKITATYNVCVKCSVYLV